MPPRAIASGSVSFGLVSIPVKVYSAAEASASIRFNMLHKDCGSRLKQQYVCARDGQIVSREETVKGYEFAKDRFVILSKEELEAIEEKSSQSIDISEFVPMAAVDPVYFDGAYFLGPDKGGDKAYRLLAAAMRSSGRAAIAQYSTRGKQLLVMLRPTEDDRLVMQQLHYADEVRSPKEIPIPDGQVRDAELALALQIIDHIARETFDPGQYEDHVKKRTADIIQRKVDGQEVAIAPEESPKAQIIDLMEALKASLASRATAAPAPKAARRTEEVTGGGERTAAAAAATSGAAPGGDKDNAGSEARKKRSPKAR